MAVVFPRSKRSGDGMDGVPREVPGDGIEAAARTWWCPVAQRDASATMGLAEMSRENPCVMGKFTISMAFSWNIHC